jgi:serine protease AprX
MKKSLWLISITGSLLAIILMLSFFSYENQSRQSYIVQGYQIDEVVKLIESRGGIVTSRLNVIEGVGALLSETAVTHLRQNNAITQIIPNAPVRMADAQFALQGPLSQPTSDYSEVVGANAIWALGNTGAGVTVAVLDTGLDNNFPGINKNTSNGNRAIHREDFAPISVGGMDNNGHGTHVTGIIASSRTGSDGNWNGIAPDVSLVSVRVLGEEGWGTYESVIQGIEWVIANKEVYSIDIMNLSLVAAPQSPYWADPLNQAVMVAWNEGIVVIAAAGNDGPDAMTIGVPGNNPYVISAGAFTDNFTPAAADDDYIPPFSAAGPTLDGFVKPDIIAPGAHMISTMQSNSWLAVNHAAYKVNGTHFMMAGTSQATAVTSGIAALMLAQDPTLTPDQVKYRIMRTAHVWTDPATGDAPYSIWQQGTGRVDATEAVLTDTGTLTANYGLDLQFDITHPMTGYEGFTTWDEDLGAFVLNDDNLATWPGGFTTWAGGFTTWAGGFTTWAGGFTTWAGGFTTWAGGFTTWAGGFTTWAGGFTTWAGSAPGGMQVANGRAPALSVQGSQNLPWAGRFTLEWLESYAAGESAPIDNSISTDRWVEELDWDSPYTFIPIITSN